MSENTAPAGLPHLEKLDRDDCLRLISPAAWAGSPSPTPAAR